MLESLRTVGALAGLASLSILTWDGFVRRRPIVSLCVDDSRLHLRIVNPTDADLLIERVDTEPSDGLWVVLDGDELRAVKTAALYPTMMSTEINKNSVILRGRSEGTFPFIDNEAIARIAADDALRVTVEWRSLQMTAYSKYTLLAKAITGKVTGEISGAALKRSRVAHVHRSAATPK